MGAVLQCLFRVCCDGEHEEDQENDNHSHPLSQESQTYHPVLQRIHHHQQQQQQQDDDHTNDNNDNLNDTNMVRMITPVIPSSCQTEDINDPNINNNNSNNNNNNNNNNEDYDATITSLHPNHSPRGLFSRIFRSRYKVAPNENDEEDIGNQLQQQQQQKQHANLMTNSPLRTASSFHATDSYLTLRPHEVVLPGSLLQQEMSQRMILLQQQQQQQQQQQAVASSSSVGIYSNDDECVICLDGFDETNPRMPTECGCGLNQTYFHLPCLYQWIEQCEECPTCRQTITWHEFC